MYHLQHLNAMRCILGKNIGSREILVEDKLKQIEA